MDIYYTNAVTYSSRIGFGKVINAFVNIMIHGRDIQLKYYMTFGINRKEVKELLQEIQFTQNSTLTINN